MVCPCRVVVSVALDLVIFAVGGRYVTALEIAETGETLGCTSCVVCGEYGPGHDLSPALDD